ncbi:MAG: hypothetical protein M3Y56_16660 [Armatimonadota bacterium]|nr:hypothetical protein [Armatimonadota bacterium]
MQANIYIGPSGPYHWIESEAGSLWDLLGTRSKIVEGKYVIVTAYDSGPFRISPDEIERGWRRHGEIAISPRVERADELEGDQFVEWYVFCNQPAFSDCTAFDNYEPFVNYSGFSLHDPVHSDLQAEFWSQLERRAAESYLADGDYLIWVTSDSELFEHVLEERITSIIRGCCTYYVMP